MRTIYGIGETILDLIFKNNEVIASKPGGSAFNTLICLGRLNIDCKLISEFGNDKTGTLIENFLSENSVDTSHVNRFSNGKTPISLAFLSENGDAEYTFYKDYPNLRLENITPEFKEDDILIFGSFYSINPVLRSKIKELTQLAKDSGVIIMYDPNFRSAHIHERDELKSAILENMKISDIVRGSDEDFKNIFSIEPLRSQQGFLEEYASNLILTANNSGAYFKNKDINVHVDADKILPISTIGAGDSFNAGVIFSLLHKNIRKRELGNLTAQDWIEILQISTKFATNTCLSLDNYVDKTFSI